MRFGLAEDAVALRDLADEVLRGTASADVSRSGWPGGNYAQATAVWRKLAAVGVVGTLVPENLGGLGLDNCCLVALCERLGAYALPVPAAVTVGVGAPLVAAAGLPVLADVLSGEALVAVEIGASPLICLSQRADFVVLRDRGTGSRALRLYERGELDLESVDAVDGSLGLTRVVAEPAGGTLLSDDPSVFESCWARGVLAAAAELVGLSRRMLGLTVDYVKQREQYGVAIGSFQAVKHSLASALLAVEFAWPMVLAAAWAQTAATESSISSGPTAQQLASAAKIQSADAARLVARTAIQCHGAMGYTTEYDLHLYAKRVWALIPSWGTESWHRDRLATTLGV